MNAASYVIPVPPQPSLPVVGEAKSYPVRRIWCVGRNYLEHIREMGNDERAPPFFFAMHFIGNADHIGVGNQLDNMLISNGGNDRLDGGIGADTMWGGAGNDTYVVDNAGDVILENLNEGTDKVETTLATYTLGSNVENLTFTNAGAHTGTGNTLANTLVGSTGSDTLNGMTGSDTLTGGSGADQFVFSTALGATNVDTITDFTVNSDKIVLDHTIFTAAGANGPLTDAAFFNSDVPSSVGAQTRIIYNANTGGVFYDVDGNGAAAAAQFATIQPHLALKASDFLIV